MDLPCPAGLVALSPLTDMDPAGKLAHPGADRCPVFPRSVLITFAGLPDQGARRRTTGKPRISPVDCILAGLPPVLIQVGSTEMLYPDAELMAERLAAAGVPVTLEVWDRQVHVFQAAADLIPEADHAIRQIGNFIRTATTARTFTAIAPTNGGIAKYPRPPRHAHHARTNASETSRVKTSRAGRQRGAGTSLEVRGAAAAPQLFGHILEADEHDRVVVSLER